MNAAAKPCVWCGKRHGRTSREAYACALEQLEIAAPGAPGWGSYEAWLRRNDAPILEDVDEVTAILREANGL